MVVMLEVKISAVHSIGMGYIYLRKMARSTYSMTYLSFWIEGGGI